jgi:hypothetical protein
MKRMSWILVIALAIGLFPASGLAQFKPESGAVSGYMMMDYYSFLSHHSGEIDEGGLKGRHGFWLRRAYFTYDNKLGDKVKMRLRLEMNSPGKLTTDSSLTPYVKDAYLSLKLGKADLIAGIQGPPSFEVEEGVWGWRALEKTPLDLYKWTSSRDFGVAVKGGKTLAYHFMFGQGSGNKAETNKGKKVFGSLAFQQSGIVLEAMGQFESKNGAEDIIYKGFGAYTGKWGRVGLMYAHRDLTPAGAPEGLCYNVFSGFAVIKAGEKVELIGRYDMNTGDGYQLDFGGSGIDYMPFADDHEFSFILGAVSYQVLKNVYVIPNVRYATYKDPLEGERAGDDLYGYLTLYFKF